ncbi:transposase [Prolixibacter denitrificans]|nr:transposase [Prolixibacter denitrificans]GET22707.1 hypothetical protein JCM18694_29530 [Prolixibacter denitrificans]
MSDHYRQQYRIPSARANWWDYRNEAAYFITICTAGKTHFFGTVRNGKMCLSELGEIAHQHWQDIPNHFPFVQLDEFVIMPNHAHGIVVLKNPADNRTIVETLHATSLPTTQAFQSNHSGPSLKNQHMANISPKRGSLPSVIRGFKSSVTRRARLSQPDFAWQPRYYDHIIRDDYDWMRIREYVHNNPVQWGQTDDDDHNETPPRV